MTPQGQKFAQFFILKNYLYEVLEDQLHILIEKYMKEYKEEKNPNTINEIESGLCHKLLSLNGQPYICKLEIDMNSAAIIFVLIIERFIRRTQTGREAFLIEPETSNPKDWRNIITQKKVEIPNKSINHNRLLSTMVKSNFESASNILNTGDTRVFPTYGKHVSDISIAVEPGWHSEKAPMDIKLNLEMP